MSEYVTKQLRALEWKPIKINLLRRANTQPQVLGSGFVPRGFKMLSLPALRRAGKIDGAARRPGVYFLWDDDLLVYVGSSENVHFRVKAHFKKQAINFNFATYLAIDFPWYLSVEAAYIAAHLPRSNTTHLWKAKVIFYYRGCPKTRVSIGAAKRIRTPDPRITKTECPTCLF